MTKPLRLRVCSRTDGDWLAVRWSRWVPLAPITVAATRLRLDWRRLDRDTVIRLGHRWRRAFGLRPPLSLSGLYRIATRLDAWLAELPALPPQQRIEVKPPVIAPAADPSAP